MAPVVRIIGAGLAGCEAAWQLARRGAAVELFEMRPHRMTEAHTSGELAELVCSNSFRSLALTAPAGLLKEEMRRLDSLVVRVADGHRVPAGSALAVDRERFSRALSRAMQSLPEVRLIREEVTELPPDVVIVATGPLTSPSLSRHLASLLGSDHLYFYDAISPIVTAESIDMAVAFRGSRYEREADDYINCPLTQPEYDRFVNEVLAADKVPTRSFERFVPFEGCMPIEEMARRGRETLAFGPMKSVGLADPRTRKSPYAVVQLRQENHEGTLYNMVGFQTKMTYPEQKRVFSLIPGLEKAEFVRLGSLHRNTFIDSPRHLNPTLQWRQNPNVFFAGQITGVEGYVESAATGIVAGINASRWLEGAAPVVPPETTAVGALLRYITDKARTGFQPMNVNFGLLPALATPLRGKARKELMASRALAAMEAFALRVAEEIGCARGPG
ncbi:MAG: methylenetetrahydrofolate--tRNA-(uracil(54)-C(5))-methyltransferase (FADH(2)-oxidizing) TrmFO [Deltaproteobacteria bacterium]|nr:methylenetetrahydrofolate--tRNA-(uracil(54)-C(5))-methyltransferase (FADH(2)-oxidizing) TrmFO [Deltaproteobacteria bacterium]